MFLGLAFGSLFYNLINEIYSNDFINNGGWKILYLIVATILLAIFVFSKFYLKKNFIVVLDFYDMQNINFINILKNSFILFVPIFCFFLFSFSNWLPKFSNPDNLYFLSYGFLLSSRSSSPRLTAPSSSSGSRQNTRSICCRSCRGRFQQSRRPFRRHCSWRSQRTGVKSSSHRVRFRSARSQRARCSRTAVRWRQLSPPSTRHVDRRQEARCSRCKWTDFPQTSRWRTWPSAL